MIHAVTRDFNMLFQTIKQAILPFFMLGYQRAEFVVLLGDAFAVALLFHAATLYEDIFQRRLGLPVAFVNQRVFGQTARVGDHDMLEIDIQLRIASDLLQARIQRVVGFFRKLDEFLTENFAVACAANAERAIDPFLTVTWFTRE